MKLIWLGKAWEEYLKWHEKDKKLLNKIHNLLQSICRNGYDCIGKPEPLKGDLQGYWSVRIDKGDRIVFKVADDEVEIVQCGSHYRDK